MRLFLAAELPPAALRAAADLVPDGITGVRGVRRETLHVTLHFLGEADVDAVRGALAPHPQVSFELGLAGLGRFALPGGDEAVWAGVAPHDPLFALHASTAAALATVGFRPEPRPYTPHVTLARGAPGPWSEALLARHAGLSTAPEPVEGFALWSSALEAGAHRYTLVERYGAPRR